RVGDGANANGVRRVRDVEQQAVAAARAAGATDGRIDRDVVALVRTRARAAAGRRRRAEHLRDDARELRAQLGAVGTGRRAAATARGDEAVEQHFRELV